MAPTSSLRGAVHGLLHTGPRSWRAAFRISRHSAACFRYASSSAPSSSSATERAAASSDDKSPPRTATAQFARTALRDNKPLDIRAFEPARIRNFSIIAHIDHGKSTIADRILELTGTIRSGGLRKQVLDKLQVEQERGITVKAQTATSFFEHKGVEYALNLIDTPGHVDFNYEVRCSLAACQGTLLVVDATQGVQAQTLANFYLAFEREVHKRGRGIGSGGGWE